MGVYLPNIEMPKEGRLTLQISADGAVYVVNSCSITAETYTTDAVPVPPHGDLIDRDALKAAICSRLCIKSEKYLSPEEATIVNEIFDAPTIIPADVTDINVVEME